MAQQTRAQALGSENSGRWMFLSHVDASLSLSLKSVSMSSSEDKKIHLQEWPGLVFTTRGVGGLGWEEDRVLGLEL